MRIYRKHETPIEGVFFDGKNYSEVFDLCFSHGPIDCISVESITVFTEPDDTGKALLCGDIKICLGQIGSRPKSNHVLKRHQWIVFNNLGLRIYDQIEFCEVYKEHP